MSRSNFRGSRFHALSAVSRQGRELFKRHTDLIEPLALDEAYLDVTQNKTGLLVARAIREQLREELNLTASAGVAPNKFLAKLASDWRKADGLSVSSSLRTSMRFYHRCRLGACLESAKSPGEKLGKLGIQTLRDLRSLDLPVLEHHFGRCGQRLYDR